MATAEEVLKLRQYINEPDDCGEWADVRLGEYIDASSNLYNAAAEIWGIKAGQYSGLVNVSESGSSRSLGDLLKNAERMAKHYRELGTAEDNAGLASAIQIRPIRRAARPA